MEHEHLIFSGPIMVATPGIPREMIRLLHLPTAASQECGESIPHKGTGIRLRKVDVIERPPTSRPGVTERPRNVEAKRTPNIVQDEQQYFHTMVVAWAARHPRNDTVLRACVCARWVSVTSGCAAHCSLAVVVVEVVVTVRPSASHGPGRAGHKTVGRAAALCHSLIDHEGD